MKQKNLLSLILELIVRSAFYIIIAVLLLVLLIILVIYIKSTVTTITDTVVDGTTSEETEIQPPEKIELCDTSWQSPMSEITGTIKKAEYRTKPGADRRELYIDIEDGNKQDFVIHVFPEAEISKYQYQDVFSFKEGETVTVVGSELSTREGQKDICAAAITRENAETVELRDKTTGKHIIPPVTVMPPTIESCGQPWTIPLMEINGTIKKIEDRPQPWSGRVGLHLDVETANQENFVIHVFPEAKTRQCPDLFSFQEGETVTVIGSAFSTPRIQYNICAAEIIGQNSGALKLRDQTTGNHNNSVFNNEICHNDDKAMDTCLIDWMKSYISCRCEDCADEMSLFEDTEGLLTACNGDCADRMTAILTMENTTGILAGCGGKDCAEKIAVIPKVYKGDCAICQEKMCSQACSDPNAISPICWKICMGRCGKMSANAMCTMCKIHKEQCASGNELSCSILQNICFDTAGL